MKTILAIIISLSMYVLILLFFHIGNIKQHQTESSRKTFSIFVISFFVALFFLIILFMQAKCAELAIFTIGFLLAFIAGLISISTLNKDTPKIDKLKSRLCTSSGVIIGLLIMEFSIVAYVSPEYQEFILDVLTPISIFSLFPIAGIVMLYLGFSNFIKPQEYSVVVSAECIDIKTRIDRHEIDGRIHYETTYCPVYEYSFNGISYTECDNIYTNKKHCPANNSEVSLFINSNNPNSFWDVKRRRTAGQFLIILGFVFVLVSISIIFLFLKTNQ